MSGPSQSPEGTTETKASAGGEAWNQRVQENPGAGAFRTSLTKDHKRVRVCCRGNLGAQPVLWLATFCSVWGEAQNASSWAVLVPEGPLQNLRAKR